MKMKYNFFEHNFGPHFCEKKMKEVKKLINASISFTLAGMPGVGVTIFLKYLATTNLAYFVYVDSYLFPALSKKEFFQALLTELGGKSNSKNSEELFQKCLEQLKEVSGQHPKIVLIFNRFDQLKKEFDSEFFSNIWSFRHVALDKISIITTSNKPLYEIAPEAIKVGHLNVFSKVVYFLPFSPKDTQRIIDVSLAHNLIVDNKTAKIALHCSGGHHQLLQMLLKSARPTSPLQDQFIKIQLRELYEFLNHKQKKTVQKIAFRKGCLEVDDYLLQIGLVKKHGKDYELFTPLLAEYLKNYLPLKLPQKEARLFKLLKSNLGQLVKREVIFNLLWPENNQDYDKASEWALNALIYRLRKNQGFINSGYIIENYKKEGYLLIKN